MLRKGKTTRIKEAEGTIAAVMGEIAVQGDDATRSKSTEQIMYVCSHAAHATHTVRTACTRSTPPYR